MSKMCIGYSVTTNSSNHKGLTATRPLWLHQYADAFRTLS
ncbi:hypothetical protein GPLA_1836 [Paraglaciecola polaris LMG 21857]|uniref:Uncharacterized protein n=1 Tax=Paraglaciecola polaris LMG 21857 TaxID=1129793 RepID=K6ZVB7_9ALTE|nr:hypothetical protein GPLA_1836 [Paraglaciecola polaris LMG 21857]